MTQPTHKSEQTDDVGLNRIQNNVRDLVAYVRSLAWLSRRAYAELTVDTTIGVAAYAKLLEATITTDRARSYLAVTFTASGVKTTNNGTPQFRIVVDGTPAKGLALAVPVTYQFNCAIVARVAVTKGMHKVRVDWLTNTASAQINAATVVEEHAALLVQEEAPA